MIAKPDFAKIEADLLTTIDTAMDQRA